MRADALRASDGAVLLDVVVVPGAPRSEIRRDDGWRPAIRVGVAAPAVRGRANEELLRFLADVFGVPRSAIAIDRGSTARAKTIAVAGIDLAEALRRLPGRRI